jgi:hypothetical protein
MDIERVKNALYLFNESKKELRKKRPALEMGEDELDKISPPVEKKKGKIEEKFLREVQAKKARFNESARKMQEKRAARKQAKQGK